MSKTQTINYLSLVSISGSKFEGYSVVGTQETVINLMVEDEKQE